MTKIVQMLLRMPDTLRDILKGEAKAKGKTVNGLILEILWAWAEK